MYLLAFAKLPINVGEGNGVQNRVQNQHFYHISPDNGPHSQSRGDFAMFQLLVYMTWKNLVGL